MRLGNGCPKFAVDVLAASGGAHSRGGPPPPFGMSLVLLPVASVAGVIAGCLRKGSIFRRVQIVSVHCLIVLAGFVVCLFAVHLTGVQPRCL